MKLELYYYDQCPFCAMVLRKIQELSLSKFITFKNTLESNEAREFHMQTTGRSTVPCLYINDKPLFESRDILIWLEENASSISKEV